VDTKRRRCVVECWRLTGNNDNEVAADASVNDRDVMNHAAALSTVTRRMDRVRQCPVDIISTDAERRLRREAIRQVSHLELIGCSSPCHHPDTHRNRCTSLSRRRRRRDFISETVTAAASPPPAPSVLLSIHRPSVRHPRTFMNDWLVITWHWRRWIINVAVLVVVAAAGGYLSRWDPPQTWVRRRQCQRRPFGNYFQTDSPTNSRD